MPPPPAYVPMSDPLSISNTITTPEPSPVVQTEENIPSWLKVPSSTISEPTETVQSPVETPTETFIAASPVETSMDPLMDLVPTEAPIENNPTENIFSQEASPVIETPMDPLSSISTPSENNSDDSIPDWIKNTQTNTDIIPEPQVIQNANTTTSDNTDIGIVTERVSPDDDKLPDWLISSLKNDVTPPPVVEDPIMETVETQNEEIIETPSLPIQPTI